MRDYLVNMTMEMARYPLDGIKMDTIRYGGGSYSYDSYSNQAFAASGYASRAQWQRDQVTELVRMVRGAINEYKPYLWLAADVWQGYSSWYNGVYQESRRWTSEDLIDYIQIMGYTTSDSSFRGGVDSYVDHKDDNLVNAGPYAFVPGNTAHGRVATEEEGIGHLKKQIEYARGEGADGISIFKYDFLRTHPSYGWALKEGPYEIYTRPPIKEQRVPVKQEKWEFNEQTLREGWELYPRRNDYPQSGQWKIHNSTSGTRLVSPLINLEPENVTTMEFRACNKGKEPMTISFEWKKGPGMVTDPDAEPINYLLPPDGKFHIYSTRFDNVAGWYSNNSGNTTKGENISRLQFAARSGNDPDTVLTFDYIRLLSIPDCQKEWLLLGPFPNVDYEYAINNNHLRTNENISIFDDHNISIYPKPGDSICGHEWKIFNTSRDYIDFKDRELGSDFNTMYAFSYIVADNGGDFILSLAADDGIKVWINGELVLEKNLTAQDANLNKYTLAIQLKEGLNTLLVKVAQQTDEFGFFANIAKANNISLSPDVRFYPFLPEVPAPSPDDCWEGWHTRSDPVFSFESVEIDDPAPIFDISTYWWKVDSSKPFSITINETDGMNGTYKLELPEQSKGDHVFAIRATDGLGRNSSWGTHNFKIDFGIPSYTEPIPDRIMITAADRESGDAFITWNWDIAKKTVSGISSTEIMIGTTPGKSDIYNETAPGVVTSFTFADITNQYEFIYLTVIPFSSAGLEGLSSPSFSGVLVDITPPDKIALLSFDIQMSADGRSVDTYVLSWEKVQDQGASTGIDHYVVEYTSQNMLGWFLLKCLGDEESSYNFLKPGRSERYRFRVYALDGAGNHGPPSDELTIPNLPPIAMISPTHLEDDNPATYERIFVTANRSYDTDGVVTGFFWNFGDGTFSYGQWAYHTYHFPHQYNLSLTVYDDFGSYNRTTRIVNVTDRIIDEPVVENITNEPGPEGNVSKSNRTSLFEIGLYSPMSRILIAVSLIFISLICAGVYSNIVFRRREQARFTNYISPYTGEPPTKKFRRQKNHKIRK